MYFHRNPKPRDLPIAIGVQRSRLQRLGRGQTCRSRTREPERMLKPVSAAAAKACSPPKFRYV